MSILGYLKEMKNNTKTCYHELESYLHKYGVLFEGKVTLEFSRYNMIFSIRDFMNEINITYIEKEAKSNLKVYTTSIYKNSTAKVLIERYNNDFELIETISSYYIKNENEINKLIQTLKDEHIYCDKIIIGKNNMYLK